MIGVLGSVLTFIDERPLFLREQANKLYDVGPYYLAKDLVEFPLTVLIPLFFTCFYPVMAQNVTPVQFGNFYAIQFLVALSTGGFGQLAGSFFDKAEQACFFVPILILPFILFAGFLTNIDTFPDWVGWFQYFSPMRYSFEAMIRNEFEHYHDLPIYLPNPISFLNFEIGFSNCMALLALTVLGIKFASFFALKVMVKKFQ
jgi:ABC-type multidrug transport system permease subunit